MQKLNIAVVGSGISGLSAAWLLSKSHNVTVFEADQRLGGHAHTEVLGKVSVDVGFIVFNEKTYPNFTAFLRHLDVATNETEMGFGVSLNGGAIEYTGTNLRQLVGSPRAALSRAHWAMMADIARFYRTAKTLAHNLDDEVSLGQFLRQNKFSQAFIERHLIPMAAAIWSSHPGHMLDYPAKAFISFFDNHQLLNLGSRDKWQSVAGGSQNYVAKLLESTVKVHRADAVVKVRRSPLAVNITCASGLEATFDHVVMATHADQSLKLLDQPQDEEINLLKPFKYSNNQVVLHRDAALMPKRKAYWSSWNYIGDLGADHCGVTYWMNSLQKLDTNTDHFVSLNPVHAPKPELTDLSYACTHPIFDCHTLKAQRDLWSLQGRKNTWFCGAYFGAGFHEDGLQAGLGVAEQLGGMDRPWTVANPSGRIHVSQQLPTIMAAE
ncbi:MAG: FAD-dependent oxidoreductase [Aestuariivirga sp.]